MKNLLRISIVLIVLLLIIFNFKSDNSSSTVIVVEANDPVYGMEIGYKYLPQDDDVLCIFDGQELVTYIAPEGYWTIEDELLSIEDWAHNHISAPYPNPTKGNVSFNLENSGGPISISIHNLLGQELFETELDNGNGIVKLNLNDNWSGTLFVTFEGNFGIVHKKIIKL